ncbi:hypothetical protein AB9Q10_14270 [Streptomyces krungchingensis]|uniref:hypothetical protein n=1 Tax=Streptomyces krungchingensis TaxID=1565034 RepID=UPI003CEE1ADA
MLNWTRPAARSAAALTVTAAVALLATACSPGEQARGGHDGQDGEDTAPAVATSFAHAPKAYPLDAYIPDARETDAVNRAVSVLARSCMQKYGVSRPAYQAPAGELPPHARKYGPTDLESVHVYGYKPPLPDGVTKRQAVAAQQRGAAQERTITPAAKAVYTGTAQRADKKSGTAAAPVPDGVPEGGCHGAAQRAALADRAADDLMVVQNLFLEASATTREDAAVRALDKRWSACMAKSGLRYPDPLSAVDDTTWRRRRTSPDGPHPDFPAPSAEEIRTAEADVRCKSATDYVVTRHDIESGHQKRLIGQHEKTLAAVAERKRRMVERSRSVLADAKKKTE